MDAKKSIHLILILAIAAAGCSSAAKRESSANSTPETPAGTNTGYYGPPAAPDGAPSAGAPSPSPTPAPEYGPQLPHVNALVILVGPGMARTFAAAGFLKVLEENHIPVGAVFGTEMGAFVSSLYGFSKSRNDFEWALQKLKPEIFTLAPSSFSFSKLIGKGRALTDLEKAITAALGGKKLEEAKVQLRIGIFSETAGKGMLLDKGAADEAVRAALASPDTFEPVPIEAQPSHSCAFDCAFSVKEAKALGIGPVVVLDLASEKPTKFSDRDSAYFSRVLKNAREVEEQMVGADLIIRPELKDIGYFEFNRKSTAAFAGAKAAKGALAKLREMVAAPVEQKK